MNPIIPIGNLKTYLFRNGSIGLNILELHRGSNKPYEGIYCLFHPVLLIRDTNIIHDMLLSDSKHFQDRGLHNDPEKDPLSETLFAMQGQKWKFLRSKLSPAFSSGKLKQMFPVIEKIAWNAVNHLKPLATNKGIGNGGRGEIIKLKDFMIRYAIDVMGNVSLGVDVNTIDNPNDEFKQTENKINGPGFKNFIRFLGTFLCPYVMNLLNLSSIPEGIQPLMIDIVRDTIEYREKNNLTTQKDFIQLLIELRQHQNTMNDDHNNSKMQISMETCAAQVFLFFAAGVDTTASAVAYCLFELARNIRIRDRLLNEIDEMLQKNNGQLTYESLNEMKYLELCVLETIRKYPTLPFLNRVCTEEYHLNDSTGCVIPRGTSILISLLGIFRDPENFDNPMEFRPERHLDENKHLMNMKAYIPFGEGPRACIGLRMGKLIVKIALVTLLRNFNFDCDGDVGRNEIEFENYAITLVPKNGVKMRVSLRN